MALSRPINFELFDDFSMSHNLPQTRGHNLNRKGMEKLRFSRPRKFARVKITPEKVHIAQANGPETIHPQESIAHQYVPIKVCNLAQNFKELDVDPQIKRILIQSFILTAAKYNFKILATEYPAFLRAVFGHIAHANGAAMSSTTSRVSKAANSLVELPEHCHSTLDGVEKASGAFTQFLDKMQDLLATLTDKLSMYSTIVTNSWPYFVGSLVTIFILGFSIYRVTHGGNIPQNLFMIILFLALGAFLTSAAISRCTNSIYTLTNSFLDTPDEAKAEIALGQTLDGGLSARLATLQPEERYQHNGDVYFKTKDGTVLFLPKQKEITKRDEQGRPLEPTTYSEPKVEIYSLPPYEERKLAAIVNPLSYKAGEVLKPLTGGFYYDAPLGLYWETSTIFEAILPYKDMRGYDVNSKLPAELSYFLKFAQRCSLYTGRNAIDPGRDEPDRQPLTSWTDNVLKEMYAGQLLTVTSTADLSVALVIQKLSKQSQETLKEIAKVHKNCYHSSQRYSPLQLEANDNGCYKETAYLCPCCSPLVSMILGVLGFPSSDGHAYGDRAATFLPLSMLASVINVGLNGRTFSRAYEPVLYNKETKETTPYFPSLNPLQRYRLTKAVLLASKHGEVCVCDAPFVPETMQRSTLYPLCRTYTICTSVGNFTSAYSYSDLLYKPELIPPEFIDHMYTKEHLVQHSNSNIAPANCWCQGHTIRGELFNRLGIPQHAMPEPIDIPLAEIPITIEDRKLSMVNAVRLPTGLFAVEHLAALRLVHANGNPEDCPCNDYSETLAYLHQMQIKPANGHALYAEANSGVKKFADNFLDVFGDILEIPSHILCKIAKMGLTWIGVKSALDFMTTALRWLPILWQGKLCAAQPGLFDQLLFRTSGFYAMYENLLADIDKVKTRPTAEGFSQLKNSLRDLDTLLRQKIAEPWADKARRAYERSQDYIQQLESSFNANILARRAFVVQISGPHGIGKTEVIEQLAPLLGRLTTGDSRFPSSRVYWRPAGQYLEGIGKDHRVLGYKDLIAGADEDAPAHLTEICDAYDGSFKPNFAFQSKGTTVDVRAIVIASNYVYPTGIKGFTNITRFYRRRSLLWFCQFKDPIPDNESADGWLQTYLEKQTVAENSAFAHLRFHLLPAERPNDANDDFINSDGDPHTGPHIPKRYKAIFESQNLGNKKYLTYDQMVKVTLMCCNYDQKNSTSIKTQLLEHSSVFEECFNGIVPPAEPDVLHPDDEKYLTTILAITAATATFGFLAVASIALYKTLYDEEVGEANYGNKQATLSDKKKKEPLVVPANGPDTNTALEAISKRLQQNVVTLTTETGGTIYGVLLNNQWVMTTFHVFVRDGKAPMSFTFCLGVPYENGTQKYSQVGDFTNVHRVGAENGDLCIIKLASPIPGVKKITQFLLPGTDIKKLTSKQMLTRHDGVLNHPGLFEGSYSKMLYTSYAPELTTAYYIGKYHGDGKAGDCGTPVCAYVNGEPRILGIHCASKRVDYGCYFMYTFREEIEKLCIESPIQAEYPSCQTAYADGSEIEDAPVTLPTAYTEGDAVPIGISSIPNPPVLRTQLSATPFKDAFAQYPCRVAPTVKRRQMVWEQEVKHTVHRRLMPNALVAKAVKIVNIKLSLGKQRQNVVKRYTWLEVANQIEYDKAVGYGYSHIKRPDLFIPNDDPDTMATFPRRFTPEFIEHLEELIEEMASGQFTLPVIKPNLKDESLALAKIKIGKIRTFEVAPIDLLCVGVAFLNPLFDVMHTQFLTKPSAVGFNILGKSFDKVFRRVFKNGNQHIIALDYKNFEALVHWHYLQNMCGFLDENSPAKAGSFESHVRAAYLYSAVHSAMLIDNTMYGRNHGNPSGMVGTVDVNGYVNEIFQAAYFLHCFPEADASDYMENYLNITYGDDVGAVPNPNIAEYFTYSKMHAFFANFDIFITPADKDAVNPPDFCNPTNFDFCKVRVLYSHELNAYVPFVATHTLFDRLAYARDTTDEGLVQIANSNLAFAFFHGVHCKIDGTEGELNFFQIRQKIVSVIPRLEEQLVDYETLQLRYDASDEPTINAAIIYAAEFFDEIAYADANGNTQTTIANNYGSGDIRTDNLAKDETDLEATAAVAWGGGTSSAAPPNAAPPPKQGNPLIKFAVFEKLIGSLGSTQKTKPDAAHADYTQTTTVEEMDSVPHASPPQSAPRSTEPESHEVLTEDGWVPYHQVQYATANSWNIQENHGFILCRECFAEANKLQKDSDLMALNIAMACSLQHQDRERFYVKRKGNTMTYPSALSKAFKDLKKPDKADANSNTTISNIPIGTPALVTPNMGGTHCAHFLTDDPATEEHGQSKVKHDELNFRFWATRWGYLKTIDVPYSNAPGVMLTALDASVFQILTKNFTANTKTAFELSPVEFLACCHHFWRGDLEFMFEIIAPRDVSGRLMVAYVPGQYGAVMSINTAITAPHVVFDFDATKRDFVFRAEQISPSVWMQPYYNNPGNASTAKGFDQKPHSYGTLYVFQVSRMIGNIASYSSPPQINVYYRGGSSFEVNSYQLLPNLTYTAPGSFPTLAMATSRIDGAFSSEVQQAFANSSSAPQAHVRQAELATTTLTEQAADWVQLSVVSLTSSTPFQAKLVSLVHPTDTITALVRRALGTSIYFRGELEIRFTSLANGAGGGQCIAYYIPFPGTGTTAYTVKRAVTMPFVKLDLSSNKPAILKVPFIAQEKYFYSGCPVVGRVELMLMNKYQAPTTGNASTADIVVEASWPKLELFVKNPVASAAFVDGFEMADANSDTANETTTEKPTDEASVVALKPVPILGGRTRSVRGGHFMKILMRPVMRARITVDLKTKPTFSLPLPEMFTFNGNAADFCGLLGLLRQCFAFRNGGYYLDLFWRTDIPDSLTIALSGYMSDPTTTVDIAAGNFSYLPRDTVNLNTLPSRELPGTSTYFLSLGLPTLVLPSTGLQRVFVPYKSQYDSAAAAYGSSVVNDQEQVFLEAHLVNSATTTANNFDLGIYASPAASTTMSCWMGLPYFFLDAMANLTTKTYSNYPGVFFVLT